MKKPLVTVITVCWNACDMLARTMDSVLSQTYENVEYIIVDGASTDGTLELIAKYEDKIDRWVSEPDKGIYDAMNKGVGLSTGEWAIFMNAGDCFADNHVLEKVFSADREADVIYGDVVKGGAVKKALSPRNAHRMYFCHQSALVKVDSLKEFPFDISHRMSADFKQMKQLWLAGKRFLQLDFPIADFDVQGVSNTNRSAGLWDNICIIREVDSFWEQAKLLPRLYFVWLSCHLRGK
ncbi:MAG: glycosyltransferase family 2 protein [Parabacteroides sp.]|nr:glycosyltransferase family 2 protein [Parabacteroides sp.]